MADILELAPLDVSRLHRQALGGTFQRLDTGHLVDRNGLHTLLGGGHAFRSRHVNVPKCGARGRLIHRANIAALLVEVGIRLGG